VPDVELLRLIQISDLHCAKRGVGLDVRSRNLVRRLLARAIHATPIVKKIATGTAGHHPAVWNELRASIVDHVKTSPPWPTTHLVVTGDLSTWGDDDSIIKARRLAEAITRDAGLQEPMFIYGNHDVWPARPGVPAGFPGFASRADLDVRRTALRQQHFGGDPWPRHPLAQVALPGGRQLVVFALSTIEHWAWENTLASGRVRADRFWERAPGLDQLVTLARACGPSDVGVVLTHHPVHDDGSWAAVRRAAATAVPPPLQALAAAHILSNATDVAAALAGPPQRAHAVLSGHTHETFPEVGSSTGASPLPLHGPLNANQVQLTAGTATQLQFGADPKPHTWQCLHFSCDDAATRLKIERIVFERRDNLPGFVPATDSNDPQAVADVWELRI
jgi:Calcineurin-like phosphoesterase